MNDSQAPAPIALVHGILGFIQLKLAWYEDRGLFSTERGNGAQALYGGRVDVKIPPPWI